MTQNRLLDTIRTNSRGTFACHSQTGMLYASPHLFNDAAYNLRIVTEDQNRALDGWIALDAAGVDYCANLFGDIPEFPGEFCTVGESGS